MNIPDRIVFHALNDRTDGLTAVTGPPLRRMSECAICGMDSGPWLSTHTARVSGLLHLHHHHPETAGDAAQTGARQ